MANLNISFSLLALAGLWAPIIILLCSISHTHGNTHDGYQFKHRYTHVLKHTHACCVLESAVLLIWEWWPTATAFHRLTDVFIFERLSLVPVIQTREWQNHPSSQALK